MSIFEKTYWDKNYSEPKSMDGIGNAKDHIRYLKAILAMEDVSIDSVIDLGFGYGHLFCQALKAFSPKYAVGIEPSPYAFQKAKKQALREINPRKVQLLEEPVLTWCQNSHKTRNQFDLGICTSVLQYIPTLDLQQILPTLATRIKYLYLTVPTDLELKKQETELQFKDEYALHRSSTEYRELLKPHFAFVSSRLLESRHFFQDQNTRFADLLFRF